MSSSTPPMKASLLSQVNYRCAHSTLHCSVHLWLDVKLHFVVSVLCYGNKNKRDLKVESHLNKIYPKLNSLNEGHI